MSRVIIFALITLAIFFLHYKKYQDIKKIIISVAIFIYILAIGYSGYILMRPIPPLVFAHFIALVFAYIGIFYYLFKGRFVWYLIAAPILTTAIYFGLNFIEGSRFEK
jgi:lipopolysaccharide export LptBFGC system permease protein LptF